MKRTRLLALAASVAATANICPATAQTPTVRIAYSPTDSSMEPYVAQQVGLFAKAGVNAELTVMELYTEMTQAVVVGQLDVGLADSIQLVTAVLHGLPLGFFAGGPLYSSAAPTTLFRMNFATAAAVESELAVP